MEFTNDQKKVITIRNHNVLVSAAAGSGKTAVLVERILGIITDEDNPVDIDRLLVVTFTNAAAAEMRDRIYKAIMVRLEANPEDLNLQRQSVLVNHAMITTIDSFCRFILMNHFQEIDLDPGFEIGDPGKMKLMQKESMKAVMELAYSGDEEEFYDGFHKDFLQLVNAFSSKAQDTKIVDMVEQIFQFAESKPYPDQWMLMALSDYENMDEDRIGESPFFQELCQEIQRELAVLDRYYDLMISLCCGMGGPEVYVELLTKEKEIIDNLLCQKEYEGLYSAISQMTFEKLPNAKKGSCDEDVKSKVQAFRNLVKDRIKKLQGEYFFESGADMVRDIKKTGVLLKPLIYLTMAFERQFGEDKKKENVIDFSDMEHFALKILVKDNAPTEIAKWYQNYFETIMIDEYQDSNDVQELLLSVISREFSEHPNRFMVGDMKQSIYKFRMARPEIFLEKYNTYGSDEATLCERIDLKQNFRSRRNVLNLVNALFYPLMHADVGGIVYDDAQALYQGAQYEGDDSEEEVAFLPELLLFEMTDENGAKSELKAAEGEACMIAGKIKELMEHAMVTDKETQQLRKVEYNDIVILVRSIGDLALKLQEILKKEGIPTTIPSKTGYFSASEIQILLQYLEVCINPYRDISMAAVLKSALFHFTDEELAQIAVIRSEEKDESLSLYEKMQHSESAHVKSVLAEIEKMRLLSKTESVHDFLYAIIRKHRYLDYVSALPAGGGRKENVEMLLQQAKTFENARMYGIFDFLQYMKQLEKYEIDYGSGSEDNTNSVHLMTIHKSKGLEFPICFVSGLAKNFNRKDIGSNLLLHADHGIGLEFRDYKTRVKRHTIKQRWIARKQLIDSMGEELRILYVALTRAKEKCILTGTINDYEDKMNKAMQLVETEMHLEASKRQLDGKLIVESTNYLKLILYALAIYSDDPNAYCLPKIQIFHENDFELFEMEKQLEDCAKKELFTQLMQKEDEKKAKDLIEKITYQYPHAELEGLYNKTSVSELKHAAIEEDENTVIVFDTDSEKQTVPQFMKEKVEVLGATRGSAYHRLMQLLDFKQFAACVTNDAEQNQSLINACLQAQKQDILNNHYMQQSDMDLIDDRKIIAFFESTLAREMVEADCRGMLFKEQPFVMEIEAERLDKKFPKEETMLIQGIIDAFYEKDGVIYLMDYKTDRVSRKEDLIDRYRIQLDYYKEALQRTMGKEVVCVEIYSFHFQEEIEL